MKKTIYVMAILLATMVTFTACKETKKEEVKEEAATEDHTGHDHESEEATAAVYQCPMDCEKGKTYEAEGSCPVCNMALKEKAEGSEMEHNEGCKCKENGECTCEEGKCECKSEVASMTKESKKCEAGKCVCKA